MENSVCIARLYYKYGSSSTDRIIKVLENVKIIVNKDGNYYPLNEETINMIKSSPRGKAISFLTSISDLEKTPITGLKKWMDKTVLIKSSSRFAFKPDLGEMVDQIQDDILFNTRLKAIEYIEGAYEVLEGTEGEHFLMKIALYE